MPFPKGIRLYVYEKCADREEDFGEYLGLSPEEVAELLDAQGADGKKKRIASELTTEAEDGQEVIAWYADVTDDEESVEGSDIAQELVLAGPVLLDDHQNDVAERTRQLAENLGLAPEFPEALELAAKYHDEGKRDLRFQQMLGADPDAEALAKSGHRSVAEAYRARSRSALPRGWRHEQLSALMVAASPEKVGSTATWYCASLVAVTVTAGSPSLTTQDSCSRKATCPRERTTKRRGTGDPTLQRRLLGQSHGAYEPHLRPVRYRLP